MMPGGGPCSCAKEVQLEGIGPSSTGTGHIPFVPGDLSLSCASCCHAPSLPCCPPLWSNSQLHSLLLCYQPGSWGDHHRGLSAPGFTGPMEGRVPRSHSTLPALALALARREAADAWLVPTLLHPHELSKSRLRLSVLTSDPNGKLLYVCPRGHRTVCPQLEILPASHGSSGPRVTYGKP